MVDETSITGTAGTHKHGLLPPPPPSNPHTGGTTPGADGTQIGMAGTPHGAGIPHGGQDLRPGGMASRTGMPGTDPLPPKGQESMFLKHK